MLYLGTPCCYANGVCKHAVEDPKYLGKLDADEPIAVKLDMRFIRDIKPGRSWDELVLPQGHRDVVQAMVQHHAVSPKDNTNKQKIRFQSDLVEGKGTIRELDMPCHFLR